MNIPRLATRNRRHWNDGKALFLRIVEDGRIDPREADEFLEWQGGGHALGTVLDVNDARGRATSPQQVDALNREYDAWLMRLPEVAA